MKGCSELLKLRLVKNREVGKFLSKLSQVVGWKGLLVKALVNSFDKLFSIGSNQAKHYSYQIANELVKNHDCLAMEDFESQKMIQSLSKLRKDFKKSPFENKEKIWKSIRKSIQQVRWNTTQNIVARKVEETSGQLVKVDPAYTSQICSFCDEPAKEKIELSQRVYECWNCREKLDRDVNPVIF